MATATATVQSMKSGISPEEWEIRVHLAAAFRLAAMEDWDELLFAHLSARAPGEPNHFLMHPAHMLFEEVTASNLHKLDENSNHVNPSDEIRTSSPILSTRASTTPFLRRTASSTCTPRRRPR